MFVQTVLVAVIALLVGLATCFAGFRLFVILLPVWAFFAGFLATAQGIQDLFGGGFLATISSWVFGLAIGVLLAVASYFFYYAAIVILALTVGYEVGVGIMAGINISSGVLQFIVGLAVALALAVAVVIFNLPKVFIVFLTALGGAGMALTGILMALGQISLSALTWGTVGAYIHDSWLWALVYLAIVGLGVATQLLVPDAYRVKPYAQEQETFQAPAVPPPSISREPVTASTPAHSNARSNSGTPVV
ncbi:MAG: hypothetical protein ACM3N4_11260 [Nitrososphaerota archaeon]